jgi:hypothetical protein
VLNTYHTNDLTIKLLVIGDHLGKASAGSGNAFDEGARNTAADADWEDANISALSLFGNVVKHPLLRPHISIRKQHQFGRQIFMTSLETSFDSAESLSATEVSAKSVDVAA